MKHAAHAAKKTRLQHLRPDVRRRFAEGVSVNDLASEYQLNLNEVARLLVGLPNVPPLAYYDPEHLRRGIEAHGGIRGYSTFYNFSESAVRQHATRNGLFTPKRPTTDTE